ncbi:hypothetical protein K503DRAFT_856686 [Rhizopogon vinicolor AM-OR11-026]|uniref:Uncharacterized protein n=1 Tax=Rhizopogon vinicolor AM-OR11-026 TaxID=1314800 RepID=A0A1B7N0P2_9AGAM|nr:hypothetical protein K503DRAFT_856686 [Rhizopogon vinicolor AM-OR11-026]
MHNVGTTKSLCIMRYCDSAQSLRSVKEFLASNDGFIPTFKGLSSLSLLFFGWLEKLIYRWRFTKNAITSLQILDRGGDFILEGWWRLVSWFSFVRNHFRPPHMARILSNEGDDLNAETVDILLRVVEAGQRLFWSSTSKVRPTCLLIFVTHIPSDALALHIVFRTGFGCNVLPWVAAQCPELVAYQHKHRHGRSTGLQATSGSVIIPVAISVCYGIR